MAKKIYFEDTVKQYLVYSLQKMRYKGLRTQQEQYFKTFTNAVVKDCGENMILGDTYSINVLYYIAEDIVKKDTRNKPQKAYFYNDYVEFLSDRMLFKDGPITLHKVENAYSIDERRLSIIQDYQVYKRITESELAKKYHVSEPLLSSDVHAIENGELKIFGQQFSLDARSDTTDIRSTGVPLILEYNITQVITILNGLELISKNLLYKEYAESVAKDIWLHLSQEVKNRISSKLMDKLSLNREWYQFISMAEEREKHGMIPERDFNEMYSRILKCAKNPEQPIPVNIRYNDGEKNKYLENVYVYQIRPETIVFLKDEDTIEIKNTDIYDVIEV